MTHATPTHKTPRGFTLIELLIVIGIIGLLYPAAFMLHGRLRESARFTGDRLEEREDATRTLRFWRNDVAVAREVRIEDEGRVMRVERLSKDGAALSIRYGLTKAGHIAREVRKGEAEPIERTVGRHAADLRFETIGRGYEIHWTTVYRDELKTLKHTHAGTATPLAAAGEGGA